MRPLPQLATQLAVLCCAQACAACGHPHTLKPERQIKQEQYQAAGDCFNAPPLPLSCCSNGVIDRDELQKMLERVGDGEDEVPMVRLCCLSAVSFCYFPAGVAPAMRVVCLLVLCAMHVPIGLHW